MKSVGRLRWLPDGEEQDAIEELSLVVHAMLVDRDHIQACGGQAECGTCRIRVVSGAENLSAPTVDELELRAEYPMSFGADERLACQCRPLGDVTIEVLPPAPDLRFV